MKESQHIEWKETWRDEFLKWICGFANAEGGVLHIGRNDRGEVVGVADAARLMEEIPNKTRDILGIVVAVNLRAEGGKEYLEIVVDPYPYPVSYKGEYHLRSGSTKQELKGAALDKFLLRKQGRHWDEVPVPGVKPTDLSPVAVRQFRELARTAGRLTAADLRSARADLIRKLQLTEGRHLKRAAVLLFHEDPECFVTGAFMKIGYFRSESDLAYHDTLHGDLFTLTARTIDLVRTKYLKAAITYRGIQRIERYPVPDAALREAVLNAVVHRDYAVGAPVQIRIQADRLKIWNPAVLPEGWTVKTLLGVHASTPFNPAIANVFFRAGEIETWGRGIQRIFAACKEAGAPRPELSFDGTGLAIEFRFARDYLQAIAADGGHSTAPLATPAVAPGGELGGRLESQLESKLKSQLESKLKASVLLILRNGPLGKRDLSLTLGQRAVSGPLHQAIRELATDGWIEPTVPNKPNSRLQKYRLTERGRELSASCPP